MPIEAGKETNITIFTGLGTVKVLKVNPTKEELESIGINLKSDPSYVDVDDDGKGRVRIDFWVKKEPEDVITKVTFFLINSLDRVSANGNVQFVNKFGQSTWSKSLEDLKANEKISKWFDVHSARASYSGEAQLLDFIKAWLSIGNTTECSIESISRLFKGDVNELSQLVTKYPERTVQVLFYERDGYQSVYNRYFSRGTNVKTTKWIETLSEFNGNYQGSLVFQKFDQISNSTSTTVAAESSAAANNPWGEK